MRLNFYHMDPQFLQLELHLYLCRDDPDPVEYLVVSESELLCKHGIRWISVTVADIVNYFCAAIH